MNHCKTIAIVNQKGGVGKTTSTVNLGVGLAQAGNRVLLVDDDPQHSLTISLGIRNADDDLDTTLATAMQAEIRDEPVPWEEGIIHSGEGVDLLPANIELSGLYASSTTPPFTITIFPLVRAKAAVSQVVTIV